MKTIKFEPTEKDLDNMAHSDEIYITAGPPLEIEVGLVNRGVVKITEQQYISKHTCTGYRFNVNFFSGREEIHLFVNLPKEKHSFWSNNSLGPVCLWNAMQGLNARLYNFRLGPNNYLADFYEDRTYKLVDDSKE
jgi:hypothetical protein